MWWIDAASSNFHATAPALPANLFRIGVAIAILWKFTTEQASGAWRYFDRDHYVRYCYVDSRGVGVLAKPEAYRLAYVAKWLAAGGLLVGWQAQTSAAVLTAWFALELSFDRKYHTAFVMLCCAILAMDPGAAGIVRIDTLNCLLDASCRGGIASTAGPIWPKWMMLLILVQMYWASAYRKIRSQQFLSGDVLFQFSRYMQAAKPTLRSWEFHYPAVMVRTLVHAPPTRARQRWRLAACATVLLEAVLPFGLLAPVPWFTVAAIVGMIMHLAFTAILPKKLFPFTLACMSAYVYVVPA